MWRIQWVEALESVVAPAGSVNKNGNLTSTVQLATVAPPWHITGVGDFNGDGFADLVWGNTTTGQHNIWFLKNGNLTSTVSLPTEPVTWTIVDH